MAREIIGRATLTDSERLSITKAVGVITLERIRAAGLVLTEQEVPEYVSQALQEYADVLTAMGLKFEPWPTLATEVRDSILRYIDYREAK